MESPAVLARDSRREPLETVPPIRIAPLAVLDAMAPAILAPEFPDAKVVPKVVVLVDPA